MANCPDAAGPATFIGGTGSGRKGASLYAVHRTEPKIDFRAPAVPEETASKSIMREFDTKERILGEDGVPTDLPMYLMSSKGYVEKEVFEVGKAPRKDKNTAPGCLWSLSLTIDRQRHSLLGHAPKFMFRIGDIYFVLKVYMVEGANYQLLHGTSFIYDTGAALFPRWETVKITIPVRMEIHAVTDPIDKRSCPPLKDETVAARVVAGKLKALQAKSLAPKSGKDDSGIEVVELDDPEEVENPAMVVFMGPAPRRKPGVASVNMVESVPVLTINEAVGTTYRLVS